MPSEIMDQRQCLSFFSDEHQFPTERQIGFWKMESMSDHRGLVGMPIMSESKSVSSSPMEKLRPVGPSSTDHTELSQHHLRKDQKTKFALERQWVGAWNCSNPSMTTWRANSQDFGLGSATDGFHYENGLFSSSLYELLDRKLKLSSTITSNFEEDELLESLEEIEAQTIGNLLPDDDDDLLSGIIDDIGTRPSCGDDIDDDIFCIGGGMEIEGDENCIKDSDVNGICTNGMQGEHPYGEHPSRTLFVRNINSNIEDDELKMIFEQFGDIRTLYTVCKHRGFVMISYYDIRAARNAMRSLQNKPLRRRKLDIHYSIPKDNPSEKDANQGTLVVFNLDSSVSNEELHHIFGVYGEIKEIRETPHRQHHKFVEFYDVRSAESALRALNRSDIAGKKIKLEHSLPGGTRRCNLMQLELEDSGGCREGSSPSSSPLGCNGSVPIGVTTSSFDNGQVRAPISSLSDSTFHAISSIPHNLSSPVNHGENGHSFGQMKLGFQNLPIMNPHSLPEYNDGLHNGIPYNTSSTIPTMAINITSRPHEAIDNRFIQRVGSGSLNSHSLEGAFGGTANGSCPVHGQQYIWNNSAYHHHSASPMIWGNSPSFINHHTPQMHGLPRPPSHLMNSVLPFHPHHVGSAPSVNPSIWERRQPFIRDSTDVPTFHPGSLGNMGFSPNNIFPHSGGNCIGITSPQQRCHVFQGRNHMIPMPASFESPNDRMRSRRSDSNTNQADNKKQYELDIERIMRGEDSRTTLMIKNIPNKYTSKMLLAAIDEHHKGTYDFIYLPIDFKNKCNVGYAFINMIDPQQIIPFFQAFNGKKWEKFNSEKVASLAYARIQGKAALIGHFQNSSLMNEDKRCRPILFHSDGPNAGDQITIDRATKLLERNIVNHFQWGSTFGQRPSRSQIYNYEENNQESPSTSPNTKAYSNGTNPAVCADDSE